jgi:hypothetical protein
MSGGKMGGSSSSVTVGYKYYVGMHMALCHGPVDKLVRIRVGGNKAWVGNNTGGPLAINKPDLFGGEKREGGVTGQVDIEMGGPTQGQNSYLAAKLGASLLPAFRGACCAVLRQCYIGLNPYPKDWGWLPQRIRVRDNGAEQWYVEKAAIGYYSVEDHVPPIYEEETASLNNYTLEIPAGSLPDVYYVSGDGITHDPTKQNGGEAWAVWGGSLGEWTVGGIEFSFKLNSVQEERDVAVFMLTDAAGDPVATFEPYPGQTWSGFPTFKGTDLTDEFLTVGVWYRVAIADTGAGLSAVLKDSGGGVVASQIITGSLAEVRGYQFGLEAAGAFLDTGSVSYDLVSITQYHGTAGEDRYGYYSDMNPVHTIRECLTDDNWGIGYTDVDIDDVSFAAAADTLFDEGMGISLLWSQQADIWDFVEEVMRHIDAALYVDRSTGKFVLKLIRGGYDESSLLVLDKSNISRVETYSKQTMAELANEVTLSYNSNETGQIETVTLQNLAMIQQQGAIIPASVEYMGFANQAIAAKVAARDLKAMSTPLVSATIYANRAAAGLNLGDVFVWEWAEQDEDGAGVTTSYVMRVTEIAFGDGVENVVRIQCVQDVFALPDITYVEAEPTVWENPSFTPLAASPRLVTETPYYEIVRQLGETDAAAKLASLPELGYLMVAAGRSAGEINAEILVDSGAGYVESGTLDFCPIAYLDGALGQFETAVPIKDGVDLDEVEARSFAQIDDEIVFVEAVTDTLATLRRGCLDTVPAQHADGAAMLVWDNYAASDDVEYVTSDEVSAKILTASGMGRLSIVDAPEDTVTMSERAIRPYRPANLAVDGDAAPDPATIFTAPLVITWAHRNRLQETGGEPLEWTAGSVTPEVGTTYDFEVFPLDETGSAGSVLLSDTGLSVLTRTIEGSELEGSGAYGLLVQVGAVRDGYESWQRAALRLTLPDPGLFSYMDTFDTLNATYWESIGLASLSATDGKLVPMSNASTWGAWASNYVKWKGAIPKNFEAAINLAWEEAGNSNMGEVYFWIELSDGTQCYVGLYDSSAVAKGGIYYSRPLGFVAYQTGVDFVSNRDLKWKILDGILQLWVGGALVFTEAVGFAQVAKLGLGHTRYTTYAAVVTKWDDFAIQEFASELAGNLYLFDSTYDAELWDATAMASATVANGYLSFIGNASTWENYASMVEFVGDMPTGDCEIEAQFGWIYAANCLGELMLRITTATAAYMVGMTDSSNVTLGQLLAVIPGATSTTVSNQPDKKTINAKLVISGTTISAYVDGSLLCTGTFDGGAITSIGLTNTRYTTYAGVTTLLYYLRVHEVV